MQEKVKEGLSDQEEKLKELHKTIEEKSQKIADLEKELTEAPKKESKIFELEMEIEILQGIGMFSKVQTDLIHSRAQIFRECLQMVSFSEQKSDVVI